LCHLQNYPNILAAKPGRAAQPVLEIAAAQLEESPSSEYPADDDENGVFAKSHCRLAYRDKNKSWAIFNQ
jgi:hypothetical protein